MSTRFDIDAQRGVVCLFGLVALAMEAVAFYLTGHKLPDVMTGIFGTMSMGPILTSTAEKYRETKKEEVQEEVEEVANEASRVSHLTQRPSSSRPGRSSEGAEKK